MNAICVGKIAHLPRDVRDSSLNNRLLDGESGRGPEGLTKDQRLLRLAQLISGKEEDFSPFVTPEPPASNSSLSPEFPADFNPIQTEPTLVPTE